MVEEGDLPWRHGRAQRLLEPFELRRVHVVAVECEELRASLGEGVVALPFHVERLVQALRRKVVVAERRVELHTRAEQLVVRTRELALEVAGVLAAIHVVAEHDDEGEWKATVELGHAARNLVLPAPARAAIADHREIQRVAAQWQRQPLPHGPRRVRHARAQRRQSERESTEQSSHGRLHFAGDRALGM